MINDFIMVSVIIPTYNHEKYIEKAIKSVLVQKTKFNYEVLIGEDFSSDGTACVLKKLESRLPSNYHIFYRERNYGAVKNGEDLYKRAQGKYLILLEGDDYWLYEYKLQRQVDFLEKNEDYIAIAHNTLIVDKNSRPIPDFIYPECKNEEYVVSDYGKGILMGQSTTILFRNYFKYNLFEDIPVTVSYPGDRRKNYLFVTHGRVKCIQEKWSAYRFVDDEGTSFTATLKYDNTFHQRELVFYRDLMKYSEQELEENEPKIVINNIYLKCGLLTCFYGRNKNYSWLQWIKDFLDSKYKIQFLLYFIIKIKEKAFEE